MKKTFARENPLDTYVEEDGRRFLRHTILDLGSSLGSDAYHPNIDRSNRHRAPDGCGGDQEWCIEFGGRAL